jgi:hypothetical protein
MDSSDILGVRGVVAWKIAAKTMLDMFETNTLVKQLTLTGRQIAEIPRQLARSRLAMLPVLILSLEFLEPRDLWTVSFLLIV